jgi:hypothetical protein
MEVRIEVGEQVARRRFGSGCCCEDPAVAEVRIDGVQGSVVALDEAALLIGRESERGVIHSQGLCDFVLDQLRIRNAGALRQCVSEQGDTEAAVEVFWVRGLCKSITCKIAVQCDGIVVCEWIVQVLRVEIFGNAGKA